MSWKVDDVVGIELGVGMTMGLGLDGDGERYKSGIQDSGGIWRWGRWDGLHCRPTLPHCIALGVISDASSPEYPPSPPPSIWKRPRVEETRTRLTIALGKVEKDRVVTAATKLLSLVHQGLLHGLVPAEDHHPPGPQVHCVHRAILLAQLGIRRQKLQGFLWPWAPSS